MKKTELRSLIREEIKRIIAEGSTSWNKPKIEKALRELQQGAQEAGDIDDSMAYDLADSWIADNPGVDAAIKKHYGVSDVIGFVANRIA